MTIDKNQSGAATIRIVLALCAVVVAAAVLCGTVPAARSSAATVAPMPAITIPPGYRDWKLFSVAHEEGKLQDLRAILGNDVAIEASRAGHRPFPDGTVMVRIAWSYEPLAESRQAFGQLQSFIAGGPKNGVQFMIKDSRRFASTGGWGFAQFNDGKPATGEGAFTCFACHSIAKSRDFVFTHYVR